MNSTPATPQPEPTNSRRPLRNLNLRTQVLRLRKSRAQKHDRKADLHDTNLNDAYRLYRNVGMTHTEARKVLDGLSSTDYHRAAADYHRAAAKRWRP